MAFLTEFVAALCLTNDDLAMLKRKRGFHEGTIGKFGFKSCGPYIKDLLSQFKEEDLKKHHIIESNGEICKQLIYRNILIPYYDSNGEVVKIRPHKGGLPGDPIAIFSEMSFDKKNEFLIITEGEFKAAAGYQYGFNTIAIPGINTYIKNKYPELKHFVDGSVVKRIAILFDREVKDDPKLPSFKPDWKSRYEVQIYSIAMAKKLKTDGFDTIICEFPEQWMENGKIDLDGALAQKRTKAEMEKIVMDGVTPEIFLKKFLGGKDDITANYIQKRIHNAGRDPNVARYNNCYWVPKKDDQGFEKLLSNFVIDIKATYYDSATDEVKREIVITNEFGDKTRPRIIDAASMSSMHQFKTFCYSKGNYMYQGNEQQLMHIWDWEFSCDEGRKIFEMDHIGKIEGVEDMQGHDVWITKDVMFYDDQEIRADENGVFWIDGIGIRYNSLDADGDSNSNAPSVCQIPLLPNDPINFDEMVTHFTGIGGQAAKLLIGWAVFSLVRSYLNKFNDITPYPFLFGEKQTGKTTICQNLMSLFGLPDFGTTFTDITKVAITRLMAYYSSIPIWIDEFSNDQKVQSYEPHLKSVYNRQPVIKGTRKAFGVAAYPIRSGLLLSGETMPIMDAVKQRSVLIPMKLRIENAASLRWLELNKKRMGYFMMHVLRNRKALAKEADSHVEDYYKATAGNMAGIDLRTLKHYSLFAGCYRAFIGRKDLEFNDWILTSIEKQMNIVERDEVQQFFEDMTLLYADDKISDKFFGSGIEDGKAVGYIWLSGVYDKWKEFYCRHKEIHAIGALRQSLGTRPYYIDEKRVRIKGHQQRCVVLDLQSAPQVFKDLIDATSSAIEKDDRQQRFKDGDDL